MKIALNILAALLALNGTVWILQGVNILPGSFMTGQTRWAIYGSACLVVALGIAAWVNRRAR